MTKKTAKQARTELRSKPGTPALMDCIVCGGPANGVLLKQIKQEAQWIELARPDYIRPLASAFQKHPEIVRTEAKYEIHPVGLRNSGEVETHIFGIAVVEGESLTWAFSQLVIGYVENVTQKLLADGIIQKQ
jgi:hypothetical protein